MKKKANVAFFVVFVLFLCFILGLMIGRRTAAGQVRMSHEPTSSVQTDSHQVGQSNASEPLGKININTASATLLQSLPGIGETLAARIIEYREEYGSFSSVEDLLMVKGIGQSRLDEIRQYITVGG